MLKVLYLLNYAGQGGTERYVQLLVEKLADKKIKAYFAYNEHGLLVEKLKAAGVETFQINMGSPFDFRAARQLGSLCKKLGIDLIHTHFLRENYISLLSRLFNPGVKVVYTNHIIVENNSLQKMTNRVLTTLESGVIAVCNLGREILISNGVKKDIIKVVHNGVDPELWGKPEKSTMREEFKIDPDTFVILCASRFAQYKGNRFLIDSIAEFKKIARRKYVFLLANDGPLFEETRQYAMELGLEKDIIFAGFRNDVKNLISGSDLYVNPSEWEALSFAVLEVLATGIPIVSTDAGGTPDVINSSTNCGLLVKYNDPKGMAEAIDRIMTDGALYDTLKRNTRKTVAEKFSIDKMVMDTYNLYEASCKKDKLRKEV